MINSGKDSFKRIFDYTLKSNKRRISFDFSNKGDRVSVDFYGEIWTEEGANIIRNNLTTSNTIQIKTEENYRYGNSFADYRIPDEDLEFEFTLTKCGENAVWLSELLGVINLMQDEQLISLEKGDSDFRLYRQETFIDNIAPNYDNAVYKDVYLKNFEWEEMEKDLIYKFKITLYSPLQLWKSELKSIATVGGTNVRVDGADLDLSIDSSLNTNKIMTLHNNVLREFVPTSQTVKNYKFFEPAVDDPDGTLTTTTDKQRVFEQADENWTYNITPFSKIYSNKNKFIWKYFKLNNDEDLYIYLTIDKNSYTGMSVTTSLFNYSTKNITTYKFPLAPLQIAHVDFTLKNQNEILILWGSKSKISNFRTGTDQTFSTTSLRNIVVGTSNGVYSFVGGKAIKEDGTQSFIGFGTDAYDSAFTLDDNINILIVRLRNNKYEWNIFNTSTNTAIFSASSWASLSINAPIFNANAAYIQVGGSHNITFLQSNVQHFKILNEDYFIFIEYPAQTKYKIYKLDSGSNQLVDVTSRFGSGDLTTTDGSSLTVAYDKSAALVQFSNSVSILEEEQNLTIPKSVVKVVVGKQATGTQTVMVKNNGTLHADLRIQILDATSVTTETESYIKIVNESKEYKIDFKTNFLNDVRSLLASGETIIMTISNNKFKFETESGIILTKYIKLPLPLPFINPKSSFTIESKNIELNVKFNEKYLS